MTIDPFVNIRAMLDLLHKSSPDRKNIGRHMINNVKIYTRKKKLELDYTNIAIGPKLFDSTFITVLRHI